MFLYQLSTFPNQQFTYNNIKTQQIASNLIMLKFDRTPVLLVIKIHQYYSNL